MEIGTSLYSGRKLRKQRGSTMIESTLVLIFLFALIFLLIDLGWAVFAKVTLQNAVRAGVRYAVTSQTTTDPSSGLALGQVSSIKQMVKNQAMGLLTDSDISNIVFVRFYAIGGNPPALLSGSGSNAGGNLVTVSVEGYTLSPLAPLLRSRSPVNITVSAGDVLEASPVTGPPAL